MWHLQQCIWLIRLHLQLVSDCNATRRTRTPGPGLFERTARTTRSAPWQTMASSARPSSTRGTYLAWYIERTRRSTRTQPSPLSTTSEFKLPSRPSVGAPRAVWSHLGRRRRRCVSVLVDSPKVEVGPKHRAPRPKLPSAGSGPSGPFNKNKARSPPVAWPSWS